MAIDTENKRRSALSNAFYTHYPVPDGTIDAGDRVQQTGSYRGLFDVVGVGIVITDTLASITPQAIGVAIGGLPVDFTRAQLENLKDNPILKWIDGVALKSGNITIRAGSADFITVQVWNEDGTIVKDISGIVSVTMRLKNQSDGTLKEFKTIDAPQKLFIIDAVNGKIQLRQTASDFPDEQQYRYFIDLIDSIGSHPVPEHIEYSFTVRPGFS